MNALALTFLLGSALAGNKFPHTGNACKDACGMTRMACDDECSKLAKDPKQASKVKACFAECDEQVASCEQVCPAAMQKAREQLKEQGVPEPQNQGG